jgi:hypothetical protein
MKRVQSMKWWHAVEDPGALESMYSVLPELADVSILSVAMQRDGPTVLIRLILPVFPDQPPVRWRHGYNAAILELRLFGVSGLLMKGWTNDNIGTVTLVREAASIELKISGPGVLFSANAIAVDISHVKGYQRDDPHQQQPIAKT